MLLLLLGDKGRSGQKRAANKDSETLVSRGNKGAARKDQLRAAKTWAVISSTFPSPEIFRILGAAASPDSAQRV
jgi:hypothetical protein